MPKSSVKTMPPHASAPTCPDASHADLVRQLTLSRAQCQYLHRELANARVQAPMSPTDASPEECLRLEVAHLRQRLGTLTLHYQQGQQDMANLKYNLALARKALGWETQHEGLFATEGHLVEQVLLALLTIAHPDRWQGQPAETLAHELAVAINAQRAKLR